MVSHGTAVQGHITELKAEDKSCSASYKFEGLGGKEYVGKRKIEEKVWKQLKKGQEVVVLYDPARPRRHGAYPFLSAGLASEASAP